jgi:serine/threonine protein kinase
MSRVINDYRILKEIGRGGMATVYLAEDLRLHRQVALKLLPFQLTQDSTFKERFKREARMIAALKHEAIVPVHDFGEVDGQPFIVLEYMPGGSLANRLQEGKLSLDEAIQIIEQLVPALEEAHHKGIIHRDLKPGNILFDERGNAHLSDFGIASFVDASASMASLTGTGLVGTPAYMSPEQAIGKEKIDSRSDVYSLGIVLYEMLSGSKPFAADTPVGLLLAQMNDPIPNVRKKQPSLPKNTQVVIERVLAKNKRDRYSSPRDLLADLKRVANHEKIFPSEKLADKSPRFSRWIVLSGLVLVGVWLLGLTNDLIRVGMLFGQPTASSIPSVIQTQKPYVANLFDAPHGTQAQLASAVVNFTPTQELQTTKTLAVVREIDAVGVGFKDSSNIFVTADIPTVKENVYGLINESEEFSCSFLTSPAGRVYCFGSISEPFGTKLILRLFTIQNDELVFKILFTMPAKIQPTAEAVTTKEPAPSACSQWQITLGKSARSWAYRFVVKASNQRSAEQKAEDQCIRMSGDPSFCKVVQVVCVSQ